MKLLFFLIIALVLTTSVYAFSVKGGFEISADESYTETGDSSDWSDDGSSPSSSSEKETPKCKSVWQCGAWDECDGFTKSRTCIDLNKCKDEKIERDICLKEILRKKEPITNLPNSILVSISGILLIIAIYLFISLMIKNKIHRKRKHKIKKK